MHLILIDRISYEESRINDTLNHKSNISHKLQIKHTIQLFVYYL